MLQRTAKELEHLQLAQQVQQAAADSAKLMAPVARRKVRKEIEKVCCQSPSISPLLLLRSRLVCSANPCPCIAPSAGRQWQVWRILHQCLPKIIGCTMQGGLVVVSARYGVLEDILKLEKSGSNAEEPSTGQASAQAPEQAPERGGQGWWRHRGAGETPRRRPFRDRCAGLIAEALTQYL